MKNKRTKNTALFIGTIFLSLTAGYFLGRSDKSNVIDKSIQTGKRSLTETIAQTAGLSDRKLVLMENPSLINRIMEGGAFGNENFSPLAAQNMFGRTDDAIDDIIDKLTVEQVSDKIWMIQLPIVNCSVIETDEGLVIIDTGMSPAGPGILKAIRSFSSKKIHTIIYTHGHVDHAYGTWALVEDNRNPEIIGHENVIPRFERYINLRGSIAKYMSQSEDQLPKDSLDLVWPTRTFQDDMELKIGELTLYLKHFEGETNDQLMVWLPDQKVLFSADYYQGFLPNAGNGKRVQRNIEEWIRALEYMKDLNSEILVPSHGDVIYNKQDIKEALSLHRDALDYIFKYTISALNDGKRKDEIVEDFIFPEYFANHPLLKEQYVTAKDISKMVIKQYTGWWDDIPSHWTPATMSKQSLSIVTLAGGMDALIDHINLLKTHDLALASHFVDWAYYADPDNSRIHDLVMEIYRLRILDKNSATQEMLVYLDHMTQVRAKMK